MSGMNAQTGRTLDGLEHIRQSIRDILLTPIGSRVMRRDYGSLLPELIDQPTGHGVLLQLRAAVVMALTQWEPRVRLLTVNFESAGARTIAVIGLQRLDTGTAETLTVEVAA